MPEGDEEEVAGADRVEVIPGVGEVVCEEDCGGGGGEKSHYEKTRGDYADISWHTKSPDGYVTPLGVYPRNTFTPSIFPLSPRTAE